MFNKNKSVLLSHAVINAKERTKKNVLKQAKLRIYAQPSHSFNQNNSSFGKFFYFFFFSFKFISFDSLALISRFGSMFGFRLITLACVTISNGKRMQRELFRIGFGTFCFDCVADRETSTWHTYIQTPNYCFRGRKNENEKDKSKRYISHAHTCICSTCTIYTYLQLIYEFNFYVFFFSVFVNAKRRNDSNADRVGKRWMVWGDTIHCVFDFGIPMWIKCYLLILFVLLFQEQLLWFTLFALVFRSFTWKYRGLRVLLTFFFHF